MKRFSKILGLSLSIILAISTLITLTACPGSDKEEITITFANGATTTTKKIEKGSTVSKPADPSAPAGKTFRHWYADEISIPFLFTTKLNADTTLTAYFSTNGEEVAIEYFKTYNEDKETFSDKILTLYVDKGVSVKDPVAYRPVSADEAFKYWKDASGAQITFPLTAEKDLQLVAVMDRSFTIKFATQGGSSVADTAVAVGEKVVKPTDPTREGYKFLYWVTSKGTEYDFNTAVSGGFTLYAKWEDLNPNVPENKMLVLSSGELDGILHPYFSSSAYDGNVHGQTQISMISSDDDGNIDMGHHLPTVAQDYSQVTYMKSIGSEEIIANPTQSQINTLGDTYKKNSDYYWTEYKFLIKNGIKFDDHDNQELTIKDVIYNMYVYLDPMYTGSNTLYSTPIAGLAKYQRQDPLAVDGGGNSKLTYLLAARERRTNISEYFHSDPSTRALFRSTVSEEDKIQLLIDTQYLRQSFYAELDSDWESAKGISLEEGTIYKSGYKVQKFTTTEEVFAYWYGLIILSYKNSTTLDDAKCDYSAYEAVINELKAKKPNYTADDLKKAFVNSIFTNTLGVYTTEELDAQRSAVGYPGYPSLDLILGTEGNVTGSVFIDTTGATPDYSALWTRFGRTSDNAVLDNISSIAYGSASGQNAITQWTLEEESNALKDVVGDGEKLVPTISGITVENTKYNNDGTLKAANTFSGQMGVPDGGALRTYEVDEEGQYVLCIKIAGVDPKAIWNFGVTVTPMSYYSNTSGKSPSNVDAETWAKIVGQDYTKFNYPGCPDYDANEPISPGFYTHEIAYFNGVFKDPLVMRVPRGAGAFKATNSTHSGTRLTSGSQFVNSNFVYFTANTNFSTTGKEITNVKFKDMRYQILESTKILNNLKQTNSGLHYGDVNAKEANLTDANSTDHLTALKIPNNGYGYVGVNARYVPNINVRKAIMTAMDTALVKTYYGSMAEIIYRPISTNSWAYPKNATDVYPYGSKEAAASAVKGFLAGQGYVAGSDGVLSRTNPETGLPDRLEYTFTIAGSEKDHPAYNMFSFAAEILNAEGFKITVYPDSQALIKLAAGSLHVWAAAWGSTIDPDMYQVYHKDSQAQSVNNWGYPYLLQEGYGTDEEIDIIDRLSTAIEEGRSTLVQSERAQAYERALNLVMDLAVEYPTYQRYNLIVYNNTVIDFTTLSAANTAYSGPLDKIWQVRLLK